MNIECPKCQTKTIEIDDELSIALEHFYYCSKCKTEYILDLLEVEPERGKR